MSIPPDDPAYRPPPPRQGEPPYPGGYPLPPPTGHWQGQGGGYGPPPGYRREKGAFGHLFDLSFDHPVTPYLLKIVYLLVVAFVTAVSLFELVLGFYLYRYGWLLTVLAVVLTPLFWLLSILWVRILMEFLMNQFKITEHLKAMRERG